MKGHGGRGQGHIGSLGRDNITKGEAKVRKVGYKSRGSLVLLLMEQVPGTEHLHCWLLKQQSLAQNVTKPLQDPGKAKHLFNKQQGRERAQKAGTMSFTRSWENEQGQSLTTQCLGALPIPGTWSAPCSCDLQPPPCSASSSEPQTEPGPGPAAGTNPKLPRLLGLQTQRCSTRNMSTRGSKLRDRTMR